MSSPWSKIFPRLHATAWSPDRPHRGKYRQDRGFMILFVDLRRHSLLFGRSGGELGCHSLCVVSHSPSRVLCDLRGMSSVKPFGWRSLLLPCHSPFFARHSPGFGGREAEGMDPEERGMPSEEEAARLGAPFGCPKGREWARRTGNAARRARRTIPSPLRMTRDRGNEAPRARRVAPCPQFIDNRRFQPARTLSSERLSKPL
jgi:hypothetical protein